MVFAKESIMQSQSSLKREFLKKWVKGLQKCSSMKDNMSLLERKKAIKLSANLAMASTRISTRSWSRALIAKASTDIETGPLANRILDPNQAKGYLCKKARNVKNIRNNGCIGTKKIMARKTRNSKNCKSKAVSMAKRLVKKRTQILKGLVPGGEDMNEYSLIKEALDYIVSLRVQVDVMHHFAQASQEIVKQQQPR